MSQFHNDHDNEVREEADSPDTLSDLPLPGEKKICVADHQRAPSLDYLTLTDHIGAVLVNGLITSLTAQPGDSLGDTLIPEEERENYVFLPKNPNPVQYFCAIYGWLGGMVNASFRLAELREAGNGTGEEAEALGKMIGTAGVHVTAYLNGYLAGSGVGFGGAMPNPQAPFMEFFRPGTTLPTDDESVRGLLFTLSKLIQTGAVEANISIGMGNERETLTSEIKPPYEIPPDTTIPVTESGAPV